MRNKLQNIEHYVAEQIIILQNDSAVYTTQRPHTTKTSSP